MITENSVSCEETLINAPAELVWDILMDFDNYGQWNNFCPEIKGEPKVGSALHMMVNLGSKRKALRILIKDRFVIELVFSGKNNPKALNRLRREAKQILEKKAAP